ncbi:ferritin-2, chloroplastic isoform X3 [Elaeis guineensis]|uniref:ferritin-2, chloroplastic isoform X3 n=1 Tax=Elaeis guineensis var. tenera TaxID=51953 RepID=UPI003C6CDFCE
MLTTSSPLAPPLCSSLSHPFPRFVSRPVSLYKPNKKAMLLRASTALSFRSSSSSASPAAALGVVAGSYPSSVLRLPSGRWNGSVAAMKAGGSNRRPMTGVVFEPFEELKQELALVPTMPDLSLARQKYSNDCEAALNEQINVEYNISYVYHAMFAYFDRDNVALKGLAKFFRESSEEEREHAEKLMVYQNKRGGRVKLQSILMPLSEFDHSEKGDALYGIKQLQYPTSTGWSSFPSKSAHVLLYSFLFVLFFSFSVETYVIFLKKYLD